MTAASAWKCVRSAALLVVLVRDNVKHAPLDVIENDLQQTCSDVTGAIQFWANGRFFRVTVDTLVRDLRKNFAADAHSNGGRYGLTNCPFVINNLRRKIQVASRRFRYRK